MERLETQILQNDQELLKKQEKAINGLTALPRVSTPTLFAGEAEYEAYFSMQIGMEKPFSAHTLTWAFQRCNPETIRTYLQNYFVEDIQSKINSHVVGYPPIFYAVERNEANTVRMVIEIGADPNALSLVDEIPVLAFAIVNAERSVLNTTDVVKTLLGLGANPKVIPQDMWDDYMKTPTAFLSGALSKTYPTLQWCTPERRRALARTLHLSQRYYLYTADRLETTRGRMKQIATAHKIMALLEVPYMLIGQTIATKLLLRTIFSHLAIMNKKPLTMVFCGPSGHGKTELAKQMEHLLSVDALVVDCTEMKHESDMFGPKYPYEGWKEGSPLNNHLCQYAGQRSIVFLDELEKTTQEVQQALLLVFENGHYRDRRKQELVDCSKTIWIAASNLADSEIEQFFVKHLENRSTEDQAKAPLGILDTKIKSKFKKALGAPLAGRLTMIIPFFPFQVGEQAVFAHKCILNTFDNLRQPIDLQKTRFIGHIHLNLTNDSSITKYIAETSYDIALGARSLEHAVERLIEAQLVQKYVQSDNEITEETNNGPLQKFTLQLYPVTESEEELVIFRDGNTELAKSE